ncbi:MAG TPA: biopolymer transporter ExbD [Candidatus Acidoferrum sp.]|nr:biopolymer transporter ExbD [Candidatus Acidoferrum sp.]
MNRILEVCLVAFTFATNLTPVSHAQSPALQKGISVQMPQTSNAVPVPEADDGEAWIITVSADGSMYFGTDPVTAASLADEMKSRPRDRAAQLYIKADARVPFAQVEKVLEAASVDFFQNAVLLTSQREASSPGTLVPPKGLEVRIGSPAPAGAVATVVELHDSGLQPPSLKINNDPISWSALQTTLKQHFQKGDEKAIVVKVDGQMPFARVAQLIDICRSTGATVALPTPEL